MKPAGTRPDTSQTWPERGASILNGMFGDYLQRRGNDLAITMSFQHRGRPLALHAASLRAAHPALSPKLCVLVHGYCCNESIWAFTASADEEKGSYGTRLQRDGAYTPFYLRYNTGLPIAESGRHLAKMLQALAAAYPQQVAVTIGFDEGLAHLIEAGADAFVMPSAYEPCGLNQMYSQRYATVPIVHATGGLKDTVVNVTPASLAAGTASGFSFSPFDAAHLSEAMLRAWRLYSSERQSWRALQRLCMGLDHSWTKSAHAYRDLYQRVTP